MTARREGAELRRLDLNLLVALDALLTEQSVTAAGKRLMVGQPAMSGSLARLRQHFDDPLLVRSGHSSRCTPLGERLREQVTHALALASRVFEASETANPLELKRRFTFYGSDYSHASIGRRLLTLAGQRAPGVTVYFRQLTTADVRTAPETLRRSDGVFIPRGHLHDFPSVSLWEEPWVALRRRAPDRGPLTIGDLRTAPWIHAFDAGESFTSATQNLREMGVSPRVVAVTESFLILPLLLEDAESLAFLQRSLAQRFVASGEFEVVEIPLATPLMREAFWWDSAHTHDPAHAWMRELILEVASDFKRMECS
ncbi:LysR family transcriptional regulator [Pseudoclavibacter sp. RFBB5]|uniref:LysR family transcriptional regulator n=1 Tax=Pseudoclavibacter sp. RFBB5 TaxID=2080574 RepID=UPI0011B068DF|nr:LysR family transcriptional regulator [Pseudoclavibacter sp. RFBB5]